MGTVVFVCGVAYHTTAPSLSPQVLPSQPNLGFCPSRPCCQELQHCQRTLIRMMDEEEAGSTMAQWLPGSSRQSRCSKAHWNACLEAGQQQKEGRGGGGRKMPLFTSPDETQMDPQHNSDCRFQHPSTKMICSHVDKVPFQHGSSAFGQAASDQLSCLTLSLRLLMTWLCFAVSNYSMVQFNTALDQTSFLSE